MAAEWQAALQTLQAGRNLHQKHSLAELASGGSKSPRELLDCFWVGSLDFNLVEIQVFSTKPPKS